MSHFPRFVVSGIHTDAGKTVASALLCVGLKAHYWKPVQAGLEGGTDSERVAMWADLAADRIEPEAFRLRNPQSPHAAAAAEGIFIRPDQLSVPEVQAPLIIEGAGGLMVPINPNYLYLDLFSHWQLPLILVARTYLGSINHSLLSLEVIRQRGIPLKGIIFNEGGYPESEEAILRVSGAPLLGRIPHLNKLDRETLKEVWSENFNLRDFQA